MSDNKLDPPHAQKLKILILTDSRGKGLEEYLQEKLSNSDNILCTVGVSPGARLEELFSQVDNSVGNNEYDYYIICAGICNFTEKVRVGQDLLLQYRPQQGALESIIGAIYEFKDRHRHRANIATIPPASLYNYNFYKNGETNWMYPVSFDEVRTQQVQLFSDIERVNNCIVEINTEQGVETINWAEKSYSTSLKRKRKGSTPKRKTIFREKDFQDGVHPTLRLQRVLFGRVYDIITKTALHRDIEEPTPVEPAVSTEEEEEVDDSWNFKRRRVHY